MNKIFWRCNSATHWSTKVRSSSNFRSFYTVKFDAFSGSPDKEYDYSCTCPDFTNREYHYCKHIRAAQEFHCGWDLRNEPLGAYYTLNGTCPDCGNVAEKYTVSQYTRQFRDLLDSELGIRKRNDGFYVLDEATLWKLYEAGKYDDARR